VDLDIYTFFPPSFILYLLKLFPLCITNGIAQMCQSRLGADCVKHYTNTQDHWLLPQRHVDTEVSCILGRSLYSVVGYQGFLLGCDFAAWYQHLTICCWIWFFWSGVTFLEDR